MKRQKDLRKLTSTEDPWLVLQDVWNNLPAGFLPKLCASVPRRIDAVLKAKPGHTKYWFDLDFSSVHWILLIDQNKLSTLQFLKAFLVYNIFFHTCLKLLHSTVYLNLALGPEHCISFCLFVFFPMFLGEETTIKWVWKRISVVLIMQLAVYFQRFEKKKKSPRLISPCCQLTM